jgi:hypothetical protein
MTVLNKSAIVEFLALKLTKIYEYLSWIKHLENVVKKVTSGIGTMRRIRDFVDRETIFYL